MLLSTTGSEDTRPVPLPRLIGTRLRKLRRSRGLTLQAVQAQTAGEFRSSVLGAYERGERSLSVERLVRLAALYRIDAWKLMIAEPVLDLPALHADEEGGRPRAAEADDQLALEAIARLAAYVRSQRGVAPELPLTLRATDCDLIAGVLGRRPEELHDLFGLVTNTV